MAKKSKTIYACTACGATAHKWLGRCASCGEWSTLEEQRVTVDKTKPGKPTRRLGAKPIPLGKVKADDARRLPTGIGELDRALGGGPVRGGVTLLGGDPGIGKSTLLMQALSHLSAGGHSVLYVTGEESASQVAMRARRIAGDAMEGVLVLATTELEDVELALNGEVPDVAVIDSIQTIKAGDLTSASGSVSQLREVTSRLVSRAKRDGVSLFLIGHVTKEGSIAGPKVLEHLVDTVLSFEGDPSHAFRVVRAIKNRFGPANEVGVFEMLEEGLREVPDPSAMLLAERPEGAPGSVVIPTAEGSRPLLVECQALVAPPSFAHPRRVATGVDANRLAILLAVLERKADLRVLDRDVFASIAGGARLSERAVDLGLAIAVVSSLQRRSVEADVAAFGEVGLAGEVRAVPRSGIRVSEAAKLGFKRIILPRSNAERLTKKSIPKGVKLIPVSRVGEALHAALA